MRKVKAKNLKTGDYIFFKIGGLKRVIKAIKTRGDRTTLCFMWTDKRWITVNVNKNRLFERKK